MARKTKVMKTRRGGHSKHGRMRLEKRPAIGCGKDWKEEDDWRRRTLILNELPPLASRTAHLRSDWTILSYLCSWSLGTVATQGIRKSGVGISPPATGK